MKRTQLLQEIRTMEFERIYTGWRSKNFTQEEAAHVLGVSARTFRRYINRYTDEGLESLYDKRLVQASHIRAPLDEVLDVCTLYQQKYSDFNVKHFYRWYEQKHEGKRSYTWIKNTLQTKGLVLKGKKKSPHRKQREREQYKRTVNNDNCISFKGLKLQIPSDQYHAFVHKALNPWGHEGWPPYKVGIFPFTIINYAAWIFLDFNKLPFKSYVASFLGP